jgi:hypothetical protein
MTNFAVDTFPPERLGLITGSRCSVLFPKKSAEVGQDALARQLATEIYFQHYDEVTSWQMEHGKLGEHFAYNDFVKYHDKDLELGRFIQKGFCGGSTDSENPTEKYGVDFKCPTSLGKWLEYLYDGVSNDQYNQCQMYMHLTGYDKWVIAAYLVETNFMAENGLTYPVDVTKRTIIVEVLRDETWSVKLAAIVPKIIEKRDEYFELLKLKFG